MIVTSWPIARRLLSYSPIGHWSYEMIRSENGLSYVNKSQEPKARLRLICEVIAIFARTIRNSQRPSIIIIYRRSPNSYRAHTYVRRTEEERRRACESTRVHALTPGPIHFASLRRSSREDPRLFFLTLPWTMIGHVTSILVDPDSRRLESARACINASPLLTFVNRADDIASYRPAAFPREQNGRIREETGRDARRSFDRSIDQAVIRSSALNELSSCTCGSARETRAAMPRGSISH